MSELIEIGDCTIVQGDCVETMRLLDECSIHACVTDPPYGIGFMGKKWDTFTPGVAEQRVIVREDAGSDNPNLKGRSRSPASSPSAVEYDRTLAGQRGFQSWTEQWAREVWRVLKPGGHLLVCGAPRSYHRMASGLEDAGFEVRDCLMWLFGQGFPKSRNMKDDWKGWGTALKPGWEPIVVARKPLAGTVAANVQVHGTGAINIDGCRVPTDDNLNGGAYSADRAPSDSEWVKHGGTIHSYAGKEFEQPIGRWPANVIHDGSDEVLAQFPLCTSGSGAVKRASSKDGHGNAGAAYGAESRSAGTPMITYGDTGSAARFFYCAKTSRTDRNEGCEHIDRKPLNWSSGTQSPGTFQSEGTDKTSSNNHPTVKPTALMRYLVRLVTPPGGTVLDPFFGSGSTGKACAYEGFTCLGIEREPDYVAIAAARIEHAQKNKTLH